MQVFSSNTSKVPNIEIMPSKSIYLSVTCSQTSGSELQYHKFQNTDGYILSHLCIKEKKKTNLIPNTRMKKTTYSKRKLGTTNKIKCTHPTLKIS